MKVSVAEELCVTEENQVIEKENMILREKRVENRKTDVNSDVQTDGKFSFIIFYYNDYTQWVI